MIMLGSRPTPSPKDQCLGWAAPNARITGAGRFLCTSILQMHRHAGGLT